MNSDYQGNTHTAHRHAEQPIAPDHEPVPTENSHPDSTENKTSTKSDAPRTSDTTWRRPDILSLIFDGILTATAVVGAIFLVIQYRQTGAALGEAKEANRIAREAMRKADTASKEQDVRNREQLKVAQDSANAAKEAATAAKSSAGASELQASAAANANELLAQTRLDNMAAFKQANRAQLRHGQTLTGEPDEKGMIRFQLPLRNERPTDATHIRLKIVLAAGPSDERPPIPEVVWEKTVSREVSTVSAHEQGRNLSVTMQMQPEGLKRYNDGQNLFVLTRMRYCDAFKEAHWVHVCSHRVRTRGDNAFSLCGIETGEEDDVGDKRECQGQPNSQP